MSGTVGLQGSIARLMSLNHFKMMQLIFLIFQDEQFPGREGTDRYGYFCHPIYFTENRARVSKVGKHLYF